MATASPASYHITNLLEKMTSVDKDYRFMAINDLTTELQKDSIKLDDESEKKVIKQLLKLLEDKNGEVQNLAVRCLGPLVAKLKEYQTELIVEQLCNNMLSDNEQLRDISSIGLKTVIQELPQNNMAMVGNICKKITGRLTAAISKQRDVHVQLEALDILGDLLSKHGSLLLTFHIHIKEALLPLLKNQRMAVRKRTYNAIGYLVMSCSNHIFNELLAHIVSELSTKNSCQSDEMNLRTYRTYVQCVCAITRQAGHRIGKFIEQLIPLITVFCTQEKTDDELREHCIQTYELFIRRCPQEITHHLSAIRDICLEYVTYDPNYNYDDGEVVDDEFYGDDEEEDDYSDDEDMSWKVRRASAKCIESIVSTRPELLSNFYDTISLPLVRRFKEREESVKVDIFNAFIALVKHTRTIASNAPNQNQLSALEGDTVQPMDVEDSSISKLYDQIPVIVKALQRHLSDKSIRTRQCCFTLLSNLVITMPGCLANHLSSIMSGITYSLAVSRNNSSNIKIDILGFLHILLLNHDPQIIQPHIKDLVPLVIGCVNDSFYKITSDALLVLQDLVKVICTPTNLANGDNYDDLIYDLYQATLHRLKASDIDLEVKEGAITCMGQIMSSAGDRLANEVPATLQLFLDRLKNEITRLTTVKSLNMIASSRRISLKPILAPTVPVLANFLRKNQRSLKISTLKCLDSIFKNFSNDVTVEMMSSVVQELPLLIDESDLHIAQLAMQLLTLMLQHPLSKGIKPLLVNIFPRVYSIVKSPLLQGKPLSALLSFLQVLVVKHDGKVFISFREVLRSLIEPIYPQQQLHQPQPQRSSSKSKSREDSSDSLHKQAYHSTAKCIAALVSACPSECEMIVRQFMSDVQNQKSTDSIRTFVLLALGEIGQKVDLSTYKELEEVVMGAFGGTNEDVKSAASFALGRICIGNLPYYLPGMLQQIQKQTKSHYLLLHSLKETISNAPPAELDSYVGNIWSLLFHHAESTEEGTRNVVAECLGKLTLIHPTRLLPELKSFLNNSSPLVRSTVVTAAKFTISDQAQPIDSLLREHFGDFLALIEDPNINVRLVTLTLLNSAAHNKPVLIRDLLPSVLPKLYQETMIRKELIREVMMGPFRHSVDDGLDVRKAAFECMYTLLDTSFSKLDIFKFLEYVENGLKDNYDIKMLTFHLLIRMSSLCPVAVLQHVDRLVEPLRATCTSKVKADSVKQEFEKQDELKRSALRAIHCLLAIPEASKSPVMSEFLSQIRSSPELSVMFEHVQKDSTGAAATNSASPIAHEAMDTS